MSDHTPSGPSLLFNRQPAPGIIDRVNTVIELWDNPCRGPWWIYARTAWPAALEAFGLLLGTNATQVARGYFRPRGVARRRHAGFIPRRLQAIPPFADIGNETGKRLPGAQRLRGRKVSNGVHHLWRIDGVIQRALNAWLLVDAGTLFAYRWTTGIYETRFCQDALRGWARREREDQGAVAIFGWSAFGTDLIEADGINAGTGLGTRFSYSKASMAVVATWPVKNDTDDTAVVSLAWSNGSEETIYPGSVETVTIPPGQSADLLSVQYVRAGETAIPLRKTTRNVTGNGTATFIARGNDRDVTAPDATPPWEE